MLDLDPRLIRGRLCEKGIKRLILIPALLVGLGELHCSRFKVGFKELPFVPVAMAGLAEGVY